MEGMSQELKDFKQATPEDIVKRVLRGDAILYRGDYHCCLLLKIFLDGQDVAAFCAWNGMGRSTFYEWLNRHPAFAETYEISKEISRVWFESKAIAGLDDPSFNNTLWSMLMRNKFDLTEHRKIKITGLEQAANFNAQLQIITQHIAEGKLTANEINQMANFVATATKIDEVTQLRADVEMLKGLQHGST